MGKILVVEDEAEIQELLQDFLEEEGHQIEIAGDGVEAIKLATTKQYDLILLDIMLPKIDGYGVLEVVRQSSMVLVIMLTALDSEKNQIKGFDLMADDYVTKPFSMPVLIRKIAAVLRRSELNLIFL